MLGKAQVFPLILACRIVGSDLAREARLVGAMQIVSGALQGPVCFGRQSPEKQSAGYGAVNAVRLGLGGSPSQDLDHRPSDRARKTDDGY